MYDNRIFLLHMLIILTGYPLSPLISYDENNMFCFTVPVNPIHPEVYEVKLTDSTGSLTRLSGIYSTSQCLTITSDLYPDACGPFQLSVAATNDVGREVSELTLLPSNEPNPCGCYQEKSMYHS